MQLMTPADVQAALDAFDLDIRLTFYEESTATSQLAADAIGCELGQIAKSLAFIIDGQPILVVASGDQRVAEKKLAAYFAVGRKKVKVASHEQVVEIYGYEPGGVPPLAHRTSGMTVLVDESLQRYDRIFAAGGAHNALFGVTLEQLQQISGGTFADVKRD